MVIKRLVVHWDCLDVGIQKSLEHNLIACRATICANNILVTMYYILTKNVVLKTRKIILYVVTFLLIFFVFVEAH